MNGHERIGRSTIGEAEDRPALAWLRGAEGRAFRTSELFKRAAEIYGQAIADDPNVKNFESVVLMAARQAKAEIAAKKGKNVPEAGALRVR